MSASLRAPMLASARVRWPLPIVVVVIASITRLAGSGRTDWLGSDMQAIIGAIIYLALLPLFVIALASGWLRGDIGGWTWALARPVSRTRWCSALLLIDVATLAACIAGAMLVLGSLPRVWLGPWSGSERALGYVAMLASVYSASAIAGARGATAIGASLYVIALAALMLGATELAKAAVSGTWRLLSQLDGGQTLAGGLHVRYMSDIDPLSLAQLAGVLGIAVTSVLLAARTAGHVPGAPRASSWVLPLGVGAAAGAVVISALLCLAFAL